MAMDPRKRQKKLQRKSAERKAKKQLMVRAQPTGLGDQLRRTAQFPVLDCLVSSTIFAEGMGTVVISRQLPGGEVAWANFLVDSYCLGVKDAFGRVAGTFTYQSQLSDM